MRTCSRCGKVLESGAMRCPECGSTAVSITIGGPEPMPAASVVPAAAAEATPAAATGAPSAEGQAAEAEEAEDPPRSWLARPWLWLTAAVVVAALALGAWWRTVGPGRPPVLAAAAADPDAVDAGVKTQFEALVTEYLPEKLEWGRELLKKRLPNRFPEELQLATKSNRAEIEYTNPEKTAATYTLSVAYYFPETLEKSYIWERATFYLEKRQGKWLLTGDKWPHEWDVNFE